LCFRCKFELSWFQDDRKRLKNASRHVTRKSHWSKQNAGPDRNKKFGFL
jgi:hypothetical protein